MPATTRLSDLAERKRCLVLKADLHREIIAFERLGLQQRWAAVQEKIARHRWWWAGGAIVAGWLVARPTGGIFRWLPIALTVARAVRRTRG